MELISANRARELVNANKTKDTVELMDNVTSCINDAVRESSSIVRVPHKGYINHSIKDVVKRCEELGYKVEVQYADNYKSYDVLVIKW